MAVDVVTDSTSRERLRTIARRLQQAGSSPSAAALAEAKRAQKRTVGSVLLTRGAAHQVQHGHASEASGVRWVHEPAQLAT